MLLRISALPCTLVVNNPTGVGRTLTGERKIAFGKKGMADIIGACQSWPLAIECKVGRDKLREDQEKFRDAWRHAGGIWIEARDVDECEAELLRTMQTRAEWRPLP